MTQIKHSQIHLVIEVDRNMPPTYLRHDGLTTIDIAKAEKFPSEIKATARMELLDSSLNPRIRIMKVDTTYTMIN